MYTGWLPPKSQCYNVPYLTKYHPPNFEIVKINKEKASLGLLHKRCSNVWQGRDLWETDANGWNKNKKGVLVKEFM